MFDEPFARGQSLLHAVDPRFRLVAAFALAVGLAVLRHAGAACLGLGFAALALVLSRPPAGAVLRRLLAVNVFIAFLWLTVPLTMPGQALAAWGPFTFSREGLMLAFLVTLKSNAIVMFFLALVATMDSPTIGYALDRLRFPSKLVFLFLFTYRYLHVIAEEWRKLHVAARLRGVVTAHLPNPRQHDRDGLRAQLRPFGPGIRGHDPAGIFRTFPVRDGFSGHGARRGFRGGGVRLPALPYGCGLVYGVVPWLNPFLRWRASRSPIRAGGGSSRT